jgi:hypothetical protein
MARRLRKNGAFEVGGVNRVKRVSKARLVEIEALIRALGYEYELNSRKFVTKTGEPDRLRAEFISVLPGVSRGELTAFMAWKAYRE